MSRPRRIEYEGAFYHVMNRGCARQAVFHGESYYEAFWDCLSQAHRRFGMEVHTYCLMGEETGETLEQLAERFGVGSYGAVSQTIARTKRLMGADRSVMKRYLDISRDLTL